ncbi:hypothetical protein OO17_15110 [Rhodopseudomonas palustris]|uniref:Uncharacterized protein n=1 Tax=Rhodopseudomonas palustris TaxID=1076 RepID=A0A0D7EPP4_RHOPL|nr:hypothetical protein OO17_15110 [Rhodopseudomonas palustris]
MPLPDVDGWMIDFRTARDIFASFNNERIDHCVSMCARGSLFACYCEQDLFKQLPALKQNFIQDHKCILVPDEDVMRRCIGISKTPLAKERLVGNESALFLAATAAARNFGVISNHQSIVYTTVGDLCQHYGIPFLCADQYFALL